MYERSYWVGVSFRVNTVSIGYAIVDVCANVKGPQNFFEGFSTKFTELGQLHFCRIRGPIIGAGGSRASGTEVPNNSPC